MEKIDCIKSGGAFYVVSNPSGTLGLRGQMSAVVLLNASYQNELTYNI